ncbi:hypothetical protein EW146_g6121 [Bondarzewia mesenterica]|uniref:Transmembrane protein 135 N-terminal domain-containing protein n=1 Tax=Bondarzewia mesenterica TaxID=1095465 RepID=A0A4S4LPG9_9AGAM|nr:hypothetical protein EW146_g6121 [Bondarzewia mesenterica]
MDLPPDASPLELERAPSYVQFTPRRAITSFENLVVLANYEERLREARKMVWRNRGEPAVEVQDLWECVEHGTRGGLRAGALAFAIRSGINLALLMARIRRVPRRLRFSLVQHAILGPDSFRAAAMLGCFVTLYRTLLNAFPIIFPSNVPIQIRLHQFLSFNISSFTRPYDSAIADSSSPTVESLPHLRGGVPSARRVARLSVTAQAHEIWVRKRSSRWHSAVAGAIAGGFAIMFEKRSRRTVIAQQLFVRGLQGSYNATSQRYRFRVPYGGVLVFSLACGQILYGFLLRPDTLPRSYVTWINTAGKIPAEAVKMNRDLTLTSSNRLELVSRHVLALGSPPIFGHHYGPCAAVHPSFDSCRDVPLDRFLSVFKWMLPIYGALHFIPMMLFKRKSFVQEPLKMLLRAGWGTTRSAAFLGTFVVIYQSFFCYKHHLYEVLLALRQSPSSVIKPPLWLIRFWISKPSFWLGGLLSGLSLFVEARRRRGELAMYVLPKGLESVWVMARGKGLVFRTGEFGEALLTAIGMGMVMSTYQNDPEHLSGLVRRILYQFIGPN